MNQRSCLSGENQTCILLDYILWVQKWHLLKHFSKLVLFAKLKVSDARWKFEFDPLLELSCRVSRLDPLISQCLSPLWSIDRYRQIDKSNLSKRIFVVGGRAGGRGWVKLAMNKHPMQGMWRYPLSLNDSKSRIKLLSAKPTLRWTSITSRGK